ncbi:hypothetical protein ACFOZ0_15555 [Streptomyces yaanensis]|uniref:Uncharacterized protein n=1 Tax=Streptomyces yaanensis TaxID=1142239 RepID=A0ABV7SET3_9ACTN|nr:hypothetical protein [Streptomyces sp. CGMCC 4.7035]WNB98513.1 hypothetical protein Q2K21_10745 [Streptomyces sp. CGMCC 4.7035]
MAPESVPEAVDVICPGCGAAGARPVPEICADHASMRDGLADRLARSPDAPTRLDRGLHFVEGMLMVGVGVALAYEGIRYDKALYTVGGSLLAVLLFVGTIVVVRGEGRERAFVTAGEPRADALWRSAYYCPGCASVFCPGGTPWQGLLTPEQFKKFVWTEAGYGKRLEERFTDVELSPHAKR